MLLLVKLGIGKDVLSMDTQHVFFRHSHGGIGQRVEDTEVLAVLSIFLKDMPLT